MKQIDNKQDLAIGENNQLQSIEGIWENVYEETKLIQLIRFYMVDSQIYIEVFAKGKSALIAWGRKVCELYYESVNTTKIVGLIARYDVGFMENLVYLNITHGLLVVQLYCKFKDNSNRQDYFAREFFVKKKN